MNSATFRFSLDTPREVRENDILTFNVRGAKIVFDIAKEDEGLCIGFQVDSTTKRFSLMYAEGGG